MTANSYEEVYRIVNIDLVNLYDWLCINKLTINLEKTKYILYSLSSKMSESSDMRVKLNGEIIKKVDNFKFLGLHIDSGLNWKTHMHEVLTKVRRNLCVVRKISHFLNRKSLFQLYHSLIMSHIRYGIIVWHQGNISIRKKIQACANKFLRMIFFLKSRDSVKNVMKENFLLSNNQICMCETSKVMQKVALQEAPLAISSVFQGQRRERGMNTRSSSNIFLPFTRKSRCMQALSYSGPKIWNRLPDEVKNVHNNVSIMNRNSYYVTYKAFSKNIKCFALDNVDFI